MSTGLDSAADVCEPAGEPRVEPNADEVGLPAFDAAGRLERPCNRTERSSKPSFIFFDGILVMHALV